MSFQNMIGKNSVRQLFLRVARANKEVILVFWSWFVRKENVNWSFDFIDFQSQGKM